MRHTVSVVIPVFNAPDRVEDLILSMAQDGFHSISEVLIGNDASDQHTSALLDRVSREHPIIRHIKRDKNIGFLENVNSLFSEATGSLVVVLNSDTLVPCLCVKRIVDCLEWDQTIALTIPLSNHASVVALKFSTASAE